MALAVSAAVGSLFIRFSKYSASIQVQEKDKDDIFTHFKSMTIELNWWVLQNEQYLKVLQTEVSFIGAAIIQMKVKITGNGLSRHLKALQHTVWIEQRERSKP